MTREEELLSECSRLLHSQKIWSGMGWTYYAIQPHQYSEIRKKLNDYWSEKQKAADEKES